MIVGRISMIALSMVSPVALRPECSIARKPLTSHRTPSAIMAHLRLLLVCLYFEQLAGVLLKDKPPPRPSWRETMGHPADPAFGTTRARLPIVSDYGDRRGPIDAVRYTANGNPWPAPAEATPSGEGGGAGSSSARWSGHEAARADGHRRYYDGGWQTKDSGWYGAALNVFVSIVRRPCSFCAFAPHSDRSAI